MCKGRNQQRHRAERPELRRREVEEEPRAPTEQTAMTSRPEIAPPRGGAEEENKEQSEKKNEAEDEKRGVKRSIEEWEALASR